MTTEILRNIMYRQADREDNPEKEDRLADVGLVVLDEVGCTLLDCCWIWWFSPLMSCHAPRVDALACPAAAGLPANLMFATELP